jgi:hypothetical protein
MAQDVLAPVLRRYLEVAVERIEPPIKDFHHVKAALAQVKGARLLLAPVAGIAFNAYFHWNTYRIDLASQFSYASFRTLRKRLLLSSTACTIARSI